MNLDREADNLEKKISNRPFSVLSEEEWNRAKEELTDEEFHRLEAYIIRRERIEAIQDQANNLRIARCEAKMAEVGKDKFMDLIHSGEWSDSDPNETTDIEKEYYRLRNEEYLEDWEIDHGKPYDMKDDPNAQFGETLTKEHMEALDRKMTYHNNSNAQSTAEVNPT